MFQLLMVSTLLLQLVRGLWLMEPTSAQAYYPVVKALLTGAKVDYSALMPQANAFQTSDAPDFGKFKAQNELYTREFNCMALQMNEASAYSPNYFYGFDKAPKNSVALIPVHGAVMKYDYCGAQGTTTLGRWIQEANNHPNIIGTILSIDSPGGSANGTEDFSRLILNSEKPVVAFTHGMMCSAAYWIGSACKEIIASNNTVMVGSIGTYLTLEDWSDALAQEGIKVHEIYADKSKDKNADVKEAFAGNYTPIKESLINPMNESFLASVKKNRYGKGLKSAEVLTGKVFMGQQAIDNGLIDRIGTLADAVKAVQKYAA